MRRGRRGGGLGNAGSGNAGRRPRVPASLNKELNKELDIEL